MVSKSRLLIIGSYAVILMLAALSNFPLLHGQFQGSDEVDQLQIAAPIASGDVSLSEIGQLLTRAYHPPLRYLLSALGLALFPDSELGLRLIAILVSLLMTWQVIALGRDLGGLRVGLISGLLVACSAVYHWTSMPFAWSIMVWALLCAVRSLRISSLDLTDPRETRRFYWINFCLILAFLINTGNSLFVAMTGALYLWANWPRLRLLIKRYLPVAAFYGLYYGYFLILVPHISESIYGVHVGAGQYTKNTLRARASHLNLTSLWENIQGLNAYFFPLLGLILFGAALWYLWKHDKRLLLWIMPHQRLWAFYFYRATQQYIVLLAIAILPFAVQFFYERLSRRAFFAASLAAGALFAAWNSVLFMRPYAPPEYPDQVLEWSGAWAERHHNLVWPVDDIARDLDAVGLPYADDINESFSLFYYRRPLYVAHLTPDNFTHSGDCYRLASPPDVRVIVTDKPLCADQYTSMRAFEDAGIFRYILR